MMNFPQRRWMSVAIALGILSAPLTARLDDAKDEPKKKESKFQPPKLPDGYGTPKWDVAAIEKRFAIVKCEIDKKENEIVFVLELKEDENQPIVGSYMKMFDKDGVKIDSAALALAPNTGKKGDRMRATVQKHFIGVNQENFAKTVKLQFVFE